MAKDTLYGVQKQQLKRLSNNEYDILKNLCRLSKNIYNVSLYNIRQHFFDHKKYLKYVDNYKLVKLNENYTLLNKNMAQQIMKNVDENFKSFFSLLKLKTEGRYNEKIKIPKYLDKEGYFQLSFCEFKIKNGVFNVPMNPTFKKQYGKVLINVPNNLLDKKIKEIKIIPHDNAKYFEIQYIYEVEKVNNVTEMPNSLGVDLGVSNFATCVTNFGDTFIVDGKRIKSINQWANKYNSKLQSIKDKQGIVETTKLQQRIWRKRANQINDYLNKSCRYIINYCLNNNIGKIVLGYDSNIQNESNLGKVNNQNFVNLPIGNFKNKLQGLCDRYDIKLILIEESYTSKSSFLDNDELPIFDIENPQKYTFSGKRITRGLYKTKKGFIINADVNGAFNILKKHNILACIDFKSITPKRICIN